MSIQRPALRQPIPRNVSDLTGLWSLQGAVGYQQADNGQERIHKLVNQPAELLDHILANPIVIMIGPEKELTEAEELERRKLAKKNKSQKPKEKGYDCYVLDHNHFALGLIKSGFRTVPVLSQDDRRDQTYDAFLNGLDAEGLIRAKDEKGRPISLRDTIRKITDLPNDPYRSLAGAVRREGGFDKVAIPFAEFQWADYYRTLINESLLASDFKKAVNKAIKLSKCPDARELPGYKGPGL